MMTQQEVAQYIRLTLKQWGYEHLKIEWGSSREWLGRAHVRSNKIQLNKAILRSFRVFDEVLKHEIAHFIQYQRNGNKFFRKNGRWQLHGADFKAVCREMKIPARTRIPLTFSLNS
jgi:predicted SprT family Zn-dependent metalloprotease